MNVHFGAAQVLVKPAREGTGVIAGGSVRIVLEAAGIQDARAKCLGSQSALNNARATVKALSQLRTYGEVMKLRGKAKAEA